ncbi:DUF5677 domain-containing protein [Paenibacillus enshidis]|uniref:DUF5677 domain-containing protein n=1 Tax=Paenibacillus enshidis TaxID=1458439 RepID=A0ABV5AM16_9BACL
MEIKFGPFLDDNENLKSYSKLSTISFLFIDEFLENEILKENQYDALLSSLLFTAKHISYSIRYLISWGMLYPAIALARVRLEQTIVFSYLLYEEPEKGLIPYISQFPINLYHGAKRAVNDADLSKYFKTDMDLFKKAAYYSQKRTVPDFDENGDKFTRKWTKLDLLSMVKKRDEMAKNTSIISRQRLEINYQSIYSDLSSIIHSDCNSTTTFLKHFWNETTGQFVIYQDYEWIDIILTLCARLDILQSYEYLIYRECQAEEVFLDLHNQLVDLIKVTYKK